MISHRRNATSASLRIVLAFVGSVAWAGVPAMGAEAPTPESAEVSRTTERDPDAETGGPGSPAQEAEPPRKNTLETETFIVGILVKGSRWTDEKTPELLRLQHQHLMHIRSMSRSSGLVAAGPLTDGGYERGILLFKDIPMAVARQMVEEDPMVKAGHLKVQFHTWMVQKGTLR